MFGLNLFKYRPKVFQNIRRLYFMEIESHTTYNIREKISLTEIEDNIFKIFTKFVEENKLKTTIRVAGGWVRDKVHSFLLRTSSLFLI